MTVVCDFCSTRCSPHANIGTEYDCCRVLKQASKSYHIFCVVNNNRNQVDLLIDFKKRYLFKAQVVTMSPLAKLYRLNQP